MRYPNYVLHNFTDSYFPFQPAQYSLFKNGYSPAAKEFGESLAVGFYGEYDHWNISKQIVVFPSPYYYIPSACSFIKDHFLTTFNRMMVLDNRQTALESKIHRDLSYHSDYGKLSLKQRQNLIARDTFHIDREFIQNKFCIFLDDVRITGSHEQEIEKLMAGVNSDYCYAYFANYTGKDCSIEDYLNNNCVKDSQRFRELTCMNEFYFNVRNIKRILSMPSYEFSEFIAEHLMDFNEELYNWAIGNLYYKVEQFERNLQLLRSRINNFYELIIK